MRSLVGAALAGALTDDDIADLASVLAHSGARLLPVGLSADVASTGGPSSLSTLLCPLYLRARGLLVPKLGVRGRPAGGVDVLQTIPGYRASLSSELAEQALRASGYIHLLADEHWAPLDARLFEYRALVGAKAVPSLVIASILAKKLAAGVVGAGLEVRIASHGNFGANWESARENAMRYNAVGRLLGLKPLSMLTEATGPYQPYVGRGEALVALSQVIEGRARGWLADHQLLCLRMSDAVGSMLGVNITDPPDNATLRYTHDALMRAHGAEPSAFANRVETIRTARRSIVRADQAGVVRYDLDRLRELLVARQRASEADGVGAAADPAGVILTARPGTPVQVGDQMMSVRVPEGEDELVAALAGCCRVDRDAHVTETNLMTDTFVETI